MSEYLGELERFFSLLMSVLHMTWRPLLGWVVSMLPGSVLRWRYPPRRCSELIDIFGGERGPHIWVNPGRSSFAIASYELRFVNHLPFKVAVQALRGEINLESTSLTSFETCHPDVLTAQGGVTNVNIPESPLTDQQAKTCRDYPADAPLLILSLDVTLRGLTGDFQIHKRLETRAFIYSG